MLPFGNRPVVDYAVQDCIRAGITDIFFVVSEQSTQIRDYYRTNIDLKDYLVRNHKDSLLPLIAPPANVRFHYVTQPNYGNRGTADAVSRVIPMIPEGESVVVLGGDDCIYNDEGSEIARLISMADTGCSMLGVRVEREKLSSYGVLEVSEDGNFIKIHEKPAIDEAPSDMINVSKYVFNYDLLKLTEQYVTQTNVSGEYLITDPINQYVSAGGAMKVIAAEGEYLDSGTLENWVRANNWLFERSVH